MKMTQKTFKVLTLTLVLGVAVTSIAFVIKRDAGYHMEDIAVEIENRVDNFFIDEDDVMALVMANERDSVLGDQFGNVDLKEIEQRIESHSFVKDAQVFRDLKGNLIVRAHQNRPIARLVADNGKHVYISEDGEILPISSKYTARVIVLSGGYLSQVTQLKNVKENEYAEQLFDLIKFVNKDRFWSMQLGEINVARDGFITMYPQVGRQTLEFGKAEDIKEKFKKLKIFFKEIMPTKGWNTYNRVNVAFEDQIICE